MQVFVSRPSNEFSLFKQQRMIKHNFTLQKDTRDVSSLKNHQLVETMGYLKPDELFISDLEYLGMYKLPIITDDGYILTMPDYVEAAIKISLSDIDVLVLVDATSNDLLRLINFESRPWYRSSKTILYKSIKVLQNHLWNTEDGKQWRQAIKGENINEVVGYLVGYSASTVSLVKSIGDADYALLDRIDDPEGNMTLTMAQQVIKGNAAINAKADNFEQVNITNLPFSDDDDDVDSLGTDANDTPEGSGENNEAGDMTSDPPGDATDSTKNSLKNRKPRKVKSTCDIPLTGLIIGLGRYGDFTLDLKTGRPAILHNDRFAGHVSIVPSDSNNEDEALHFVVQSIDLKWSFQVIATRVTNIVKEEEVSGKQA